MEVEPCRLRTLVSCRLRSPVDQFMQQSHFAENLISSSVAKSIILRLDVVSFSGVVSGLSVLGGYFCTVATILESASCPLSGVERRSLLGG